MRSIRRASSIRGRSTARGAAAHLDDEVLVRGALRDTVNATAPRMTAAPTSIVGVTSSFSTSAPRTTATTGLTYAYVATVDTGACWRSHVYAEKATMEPNTT